MDVERALRQAIRERPEDDLPWLAYADWLEERGDRRAEFVRVRLRRLREGGTELAEREHQLLKAQRDAWMPCLKALGGRAGVSCTRGLPDTVAVTGGQDEDLACLAGQKEIASLLFEGGRFTREGLRHLLELSNLEELYFDRDQVSDAEMPALARLARLRSLELVETSVTDAGLEQLHASPELVSLRCVRGENTEEGLRRWKANRMRRFREKPPEGQLREAAFVLGQLSRNRHSLGPGSTALSLGQSETSDHDLEYLACFPELEEVDLFQTDITEAGLPHLSGLRRLRKLEIGRARARRLDVLAGRDGLTDLLATGGVGYYGLADDGTAALATLTGLERLELPVNPHIADLTLGHIAGLRRLRALNLGWCGPFTDAGLAALSGLEQLERLELHTGDWPEDAGTITDEGLRHLSGLGRLRFLTLGYQRITDAGLAHLRGLRELHTLVLYGTKVTRRGAEGLLAHLPGATISVTEGEVKRG